MPDEGYGSRFWSLLLCLIQQRIQYKITLSATNISRALFRLISVTVFNFTHPTVLSALLLILSASRFLAPDSPLLGPAPFQFSVHLHEMTFLFLSDRNPPWTHSNVTQKCFFSQNCKPAMFSVPCCCSISSLCCPF